MKTSLIPASTEAQAKHARAVAGAKLVALSKRPSAMISRAVENALEERRVDGWENITTGLGVHGRDKRMAGQLRRETFGLSEEACEEIYSSDELARRLAEAEPREMMREGIEFEEMDDQASEMEEDLERLNYHDRFLEGLIWGNIYGGAVTLMCTGEEKEELRRPLNPRRYGRVESLVNFNRWEVMIRSTDLERDLNNYNFGRPRVVRLTPRKGNISQYFNVPIHHSRLLFWHGRPLPLRMRVRNSYWDDSIYTGVMEAMRDYGSAHGSIAAVMTEFRTLVYKVKELAALVLAGDDKAVQQRIETFMKLKSVLGVMVLDEDEEMDIKSDTFTGVNEVLGRLKDRLQAYTNMPHVMLFNESPSGKLGGSGDTSMELWYNHITGRQKNYLRPNLLKLMTAMMQGPDGPTNGQQPDGWTFKFKPLQQLNAGEQEELEGKKAENDQKRMDQGVDSLSDIMEKRRPEKFKQMNQDQRDRMSAAGDKLNTEEADDQGARTDPGEIRGALDLPGGKGQRLTQERDLPPPPPTDKSPRMRPVAKVRNTGRKGRR